MHNWFLTKIRYEKVMENGMQKKVTEPYLVDALSFTEAEARITEEMTPFISGELQCPIFPAHIIARYLRAKKILPINGMPDDSLLLRRTEVSGKEKRTYTNVLVQAADIHDAMKKLDEGMKGTMADYSSISLKETAIVDVYPYGVKEGESK